MFLEVEFRPQDIKNLGVINASQKSGKAMPAEIRLMLRDRYAEPNRSLSKLLGPDFEIWEE